MLQEGGRSKVRQRIREQSLCNQDEVDDDLEAARRQIVRDDLLRFVGPGQETQPREDGWCGQDGQREVVVSVSHTVPQPTRRQREARSQRPAG